jgi:hypothetical protein
MYRLLSAMERSGGVISAFDAHKVTSVPVKAGSTKASVLRDIVAPLEKHGILAEDRSADGYPYIVFAELKGRSSEIIKAYRVGVDLDCAFLPDVLRWLGQRNLVDNALVIYRNKASPDALVVHNNLVWDAFGYSRTTGIDPLQPKVGHEHTKRTLVVLDVCLGRPYTEEDLQGFYDRVQVHRNSTRGRPRSVMPVVVFREMDNRVRGRLTALGFVNLDVASVFGARVLEVLDKLRLVKREEATRASTPEAFVANIESALSSMKEAGQDVNFENLMGDLFESLMYPLLRAIFPNADIQQKREMKVGARKCECDYVISSSNHREHVVVELKGYKSRSTIRLGTTKEQNTVSWFFGKTVPIAKEALVAGVTGGYELKACLMTPASFEPDALRQLQQLNGGKLKPAELDVYYDGARLLDLLQAQGLTTIRKLVLRYYGQPGKRRSANAGDEDDSRDALEDS